MDVLNFLVDSKTKRELVRALWGTRAVGSVAELARLAGVVPSAAEKEVNTMEALGLVTSERRGRRRLVRAAAPAPVQQLLRRLAREGDAAGRGVASELERVRTGLAALGAPLLSSTTAPSPGKSQGGDVEGVVVEALPWSRKDASLARALPVALWKSRSRLSLPKLLQTATQMNQARPLGFFLDLTAALSGHEPFAHAAQALRDRRVRKPIMFFLEAGDSELERELAELNTPETARRWHYLMNMPFDSFASLFKKATSHAAARTG